MAALTRQGRLPDYLPWTLVAGLVAALCALGFAPLLGLHLGRTFLDGSGGVPWPVVFAGVFLCGWLLWWLMMPNWSRVRPVAGAAAGVLTGVLSYPVVLGLYQAIGGSSRIPDTVAYQGLHWLAWTSAIALMSTGFAAAAGLAAIGAAGAWLLAACVGPPLEIRRWTPSDPPWRTVRRIAAAIALLLVLGLTGSFLYFSREPVSLDGLEARPSPTVPAANYSEAMAAFAAVEAEEAALDLHPRCPSRLLTHGRRTAIAVVFFHGLTSCPAQGEELGSALFTQGYNVYLPRMLGHGEADPASLSLTNMTAEDLVDLANSSTDLAQGLGDRVVVVGLSAGGTVTTWVAQHRNDVFLAIPVSPFLGAYIVPAWATAATTNLLLALPNMTFWINPVAPVSAPAVDYVIARPSTHTLAQVMRLGAEVMHDAQQEAPAVGQISVLLNEADVAVNNQVTEQLVDTWRTRDPDVSIRALEFTNYLPHDLINPDEIFGDTDLVYGVLSAMIAHTQR